MRSARILVPLLLVLMAAPFEATLGAEVDPEYADSEYATALIDVPPDATADPAAVSIIRREAEDLPSGTFPVTWDVPYHEILPADAVFDVPATVTRHVDFESFGILGWDPAVQTIRSWVFDSEGGFGVGAWSRSGNRWMVRGLRALPDGRRGSATMVIEYVDETTFTLRTIGRQIDGELMPNIGPLKVVRK